MNTPTIGQTITVLVPNTSATTTNPAWFPNEPKTHTYTGTVVRPYPWLSSQEFCLSNDDPKWPVRVIHMRNVLSINGAEVAKKVHDIKQYDVVGKSGKTYTITSVNGQATCTCPGFQFRKHCSHIDVAHGKQTDAVQQKKELKETPKKNKYLQCLALWKQHGSTLTRAQYIEKFVALIGLTKAGASTYYQKLKTEAK